MLEIQALTRRLASKQAVGLVIIDYLQLMMGDSNRYENRQQEITKISRSLKIMARDLKVPVLAISQLSRAVESRTRHGHNSPTCVNPAPSNRTPTWSCLSTGPRKSPATPECPPN